MKTTNFGCFGERKVVGGGLSLRKVFKRDLRKQKKKAMMELGFGEGKKKGSVVYLNLIRQFVLMDELN